MTSFSSFLNPSVHGMVLDTLENFEVVATFGGTAVLYPARFANQTNLPENLHAAVAATSLRLRSLDYAKSRYGKSWQRPTRPSSHDLYMEAYRVAKMHVRASAEAFESNETVNVGLGTVASSIALQRLVTSVLGAHLLYRIGLTFEGDAVARQVLEQIAWAVAAAELDDEEELTRLSPTRSISRLKSLAPYAGPLYGRLSETTHASLAQHRRLVRSEGESLSVLLTWGQPGWSALTLLQLADLWVIAHEWTQRHHMRSFLALDPSAGYAPLVGRPFIKRMTDLVNRIESVEASERDMTSDSHPRGSHETVAENNASVAPVGSEFLDWQQFMCERSLPQDVIASRAEALAALKNWRAVGLPDRLQVSDLTARTKRVLRSLPVDADLRSANFQGVDHDDQMRRAVLVSLTVAPGYAFLEPWLSGIALGPLADLPVYSSNARGRWVGKAHAPAFCQHRRHLRIDDDLLSLSEWIAIYRERQVSRPFDDLPCSKCGGFSIRRLSDEQAEYLQRAKVLFSAFEDLSFYERSTERDRERAKIWCEQAFDIASAIARACPELERDCIALVHRVAQLRDKPRGAVTRE